MEHKRAGDVVWADAPAENYTGRERFGSLSDLGAIRENPGASSGGRTVPVGSCQSGSHPPAVFAGHDWNGSPSPVMRTGAATASAIRGLYQIKPPPY